MPSKNNTYWIFSAKPVIRSTWLPTSTPGTSPGHARQRRWFYSQYISTSIFIWSHLKYEPHHGIVPDHRTASFLLGLRSPWRRLSQRCLRVLLRLLHRQGEPQKSHVLLVHPGDGDCHIFHRDQCQMKFLLEDWCIVNFFSISLFSEAHTRRSSVKIPNRSPTFIVLF